MAREIEKLQSVVVNLAYFVSRELDENEAEAFLSLLDPRKTDS